VTSYSEQTTRLAPGARWYADNGWKVMPCHGLTEDGKCTCGGLHNDPKDIGKHPAIPEWQHRATIDAVQVGAWWIDNPDYNVGIVARDSGFLVVDVDPRSGGFESFDRFEAAVEGALPPTVEAETGEYSHQGKIVRGRHMLYKCSKDENLKGNLKQDNMPGIDIKHNGYILVEPSRHVSGTQYRWKPGHEPWTMEVAEAPEELLQFLRKRGRRSSVRTEAGSWNWVGDMEFGGEKVDLDNLLEEGIDEGSRAVDIYKMACALANKYGTTPMDRQTIETMMIRFNHEKVRPPLDLNGVGGLLSHVHRAIDFVAENPKHDLMWKGIGDYEQAAAWAKQNQAQSTAPKQLSGHVPSQAGPAFHTAPPITASTSDPDDVSEYVGTDLPGTIAGRVYQGAPVSESTHFVNINVPLDPDALSEEEGGTPGRRSLSDVGNGRRVVDWFGSVIRYTPSLGWFHWNGEYWRPDSEDLELRELAKRIAPAVASEVSAYDDPDEKKAVVKWASESKFNGKISAAITSATSDPRVVVPVANWDRDQELLGVLNGVVNLRTGELHRGDPNLYITKRAPVAYTPGIRNARWESFIDHATGGDKDLQDWIQKVAGYTLTGLRTYDMMILVYGPPGSGKTTFVEALVTALGTEQYAMPLDSSILSQSDGTSSATDMYHWAEMRGKRMIWVEELPENERLKENQVKKLTGSSVIQARSPGEKPFSFQSQAKLWVTTNHRPIITDEAMWRRIRPVPWSHVPATADPGLRQYLADPEGGLPAILSWAVEGAVKVLNSKEKDPIGWCAAVKEAADIYRKNEDRIGMFLDEETVEVPGASLPVKSLFSVYQMWSSERGERAMSQIAFQRKLSDRGEPITGQGARAEISGRSIVPRAASTQTNWDVATRFARD
jgi:P4 family phage/plasmid primase-like protien